MKETEKKTEKEPFNLKKEIFEWVKIIVVAAAIALILNTFIIANSEVPSGSMETTIMTNDRILGSRLTYKFGDPERGDIVIFDHVSGPGRGKTRFVKRIIGLPGESVDIRDGHVYIDGSETPLDEPYLHEGMKPETLQFQVPEGCYFMMGDNRNYSTDARYWADHYVPKNKIIAKVYYRYFPGIKKLE